MLRLEREPPPPLLDDDRFDDDWLRPLDDPRTTRRLRLFAPAAMVVALAGVLAAHVIVIGGLGGYTEYPWRPLRILGVAGSYVLAALSPPQLELTRQPFFVIVPAIVLAAIVWRVWVLVRRGERDRLRIVLVGVLWFLIGILPVIAQRRPDPQRRLKMFRNRKPVRMVGEIGRDADSGRRGFGACPAEVLVIQSQARDCEKEDKRKSGHRHINMDEQAPVCDDAKNMLHASFGFGPY